MQRAHSSDHSTLAQPAVAQVSSTQIRRYIDYAPLDDEVYRRRYHALKDLVWALEDENNMIALKIAQTNTRLRMLEEAEAAGQRLQPPGYTASPAPRKKAPNGEAKAKKPKRKAESQTPEIAPPFTTAVLTPAAASGAGPEAQASPAVAASTPGAPPSHSQQSHPVDEDGDSVVDDY